MQSERAQHQHIIGRHAAADLAADWVIRTCGRVAHEGGPGVALSIVSGATSRRQVRRAEGCTALEREIEAVIGGLEATCLDAALRVTPLDGWRVELRTDCEKFIEMFATRDLWSDPCRAGAHPGFVALRHAFARMAELIGDLQQMGGSVVITRVRRSNRTAEDGRIAAQAKKELDRHLARRAAHVVRPLFAGRGAEPRNARFFQIGVRAGLRAAPAAATARLTAQGAGRAYFRRGLACGSARRRAL